MPITIGNTTITGLGVGGLPSATVNATSLASDAVTTVKINNLAVTQAKLADAVVPLGVGQTWQTPSRSSGTTYTNTTGRPITVSASVTRSGDVARINITVDGVVIASHFTGSSNIEQRAGATAIVPAGSTYTVTASAGSISFWRELR
jgi:hypothetical protein